MPTFKTSWNTIYERTYTIIHPHQYKATPNAGFQQNKQKKRPSLLAFLTFQVSSPLLPCACASSCISADPRQLDKRITSYQLAFVRFVPIGISRIFSKFIPVSSDKSRDGLYACNCVVLEMYLVLGEMLSAVFGNVWFVCYWILLTLVSYCLHLSTQLMISILHHYIL